MLFTFLMQNLQLCDEKLEKLKKVKKPETIHSTFFYQVSVELQRNFVV